MCRIIFKLLLVLFCAMTITSCSKDEPEEKVAFYEPELENPEEDVYTEMELEVLNKINEYRKGLGLNELLLLPEASREALIHTSYMIEVGEVSHDNFPERYNNLVTMAGAIAVSENVAFGYHTADAVYKAWLNSDSHKENIIGDYTHFGIAVKEDGNNRNYFTNIFVKQ